MSGGQGRMVSVSLGHGDRYEGFVRSGLFHGLGQLSRKSGRRFTGDFVEGTRHGYGVETMKNGDRYEGQYHMGKQSGLGVHIVSNGDRYEGEFEEGLRSGYGVEIYENGDVYEGEFYKGCKEGFGTMTFARGPCERYCGEYKNDARHGSGLLVFVDGHEESYRFEADAAQYTEIFDERPALLAQEEAIAASERARNCAHKALKKVKQLAHLKLQCSHSSEEGTEPDEKPGGMARAQLGNSREVGERGAGDESAASYPKNVTKEEARNKESTWAARVRRMEKKVENMNREKKVSTGDSMPLLEDANSDEEYKKSSAKRTSQGLAARISGSESSVPWKDKHSSLKRTKNQASLHSFCVAIMELSVPSTFMEDGDMHGHHRARGIYVKYSFARQSKCTAVVSEKENFCTYEMKSQHRISLNGEEDIRSYLSQLPGGIIFELWKVTSRSNEIMVGTSVLPLNDMLDITDLDEAESCTGVFRHFNLAVQLTADAGFSPLPLRLRVSLGYRGEEARSEPSHYGGISVSQIQEALSTVEPYKGRLTTEKHRLPPFLVGQDPFSESRVLSSRKIRIVLTIMHANALQVAARELSKLEPGMSFPALCGPNVFATMTICSSEKELFGTTRRRRTAVQERSFDPFFNHKETYTAMLNENVLEVLKKECAVVQLWHEEETDKMQYLLGSAMMPLHSVLTTGSAKVEKWCHLVTPSGLHGGEVLLALAVQNAVHFKDAGVKMAASR